MSKKKKKKKKKKKNNNNNNTTNNTTNKYKILVVGVLYGNRKMSRLRQPKKQKIDPITIAITINEQIECSGCRSDIYPAVEDCFMVPTKEAMVYDCGGRY